jgi:hypothetical protein
MHRKQPRYQRKLRAPGRKQSQSHNTNTSASEPRINAGLKSRTRNTWMTPKCTQNIVRKTLNLHTHNPQTSNTHHSTAVDLHHTTSHVRTSLPQKWKGRHTWSITRWGGELGESGSAPTPVLHCQCASDVISILNNLGHAKRKPSHDRPTERAHNREEYSPQKGLVDNEKKFTMLIFQVCCTS